MITVLPDAGMAHLTRVNIAFSANGRWGTCLRADDEDLVLEHWTLSSEEAMCRTMSGIAVGRRTYPLPLDDGRILLLSSEGTSTSGRHTLILLQPAGERGILRQRLADIPGLGSYLVSSPNPGQLGFLVTLDDPENSTIWRLSASPPHIEMILRIPGFLSGAVWLDSDGSILATNEACDSRRSSGIVVDLPQRSWRRIWSVSDTSIDRIVLASPRSKLLVVTTNSAGEERLGWGILGDSTVRFPDTLHRTGYVRQALALDEPGERLLVHEITGAVSRLFVYRPADDRLIPLATPPGAMSAPASWTGDLIRLRFSAPHQPPTLATVRLETKRSETRPRWTVGDDQRGIRPPWAQAELIEVPGAVGSIEAITYGGPNWRSCQHLVVALHGGPLSSWRFDFDPLFQCLAEADIAVVAPNYRGSTGYGDEHLRAVVDNWGGPDLEDVLHLVRSLESERGPLQFPKPVVLGASYGAFLALLVASHEPNLWSACVALAPLLSGPSLYGCADTAVRSRIEQLGGLKRIDDAIGPRDVLWACASLSAPLLLIHGRRDETIPVEQSRLLRRRLSELGRTDGLDFEYLEVNSDHKEVAQAWPKDLRQKIVSFCLARTRLEAG
ncbi:MAG TPA: alpha/beta fold hydrolase [Pseudonocardiaceae bacterium]|nr:alpha/beta fold hydrolase [Pseudonocardiaceae bacterium]